MKTLGQVAFERFKHVMGGVSFDGEQLPDWNALSGTAVAAWEMAAQEVVRVSERGKAIEDKILKKGKA